MSSATSMTRILWLTIKEPWFSMIKSGKKTEEYREIKEYWEKRLKKPFDIVGFRNGYKPDSPKYFCKYLGTSIGCGSPDLGAPIGEYVFVIKLGETCDITE